MRTKIAVTVLLVLSLLVLGVMAPGPGTEVEAACWQCVDGSCDNGGDGLWCREMHWSDGSAVCQVQSGCSE